jgi:hypothetical protein
MSINQLYSIYQNNQRTIENLTNQNNEIINLIREREYRSNSNVPPINNLPNNRPIYFRDLSGNRNFRDLSGNRNFRDLSSNRTNPVLFTAFDGILNNIFNSQPIPNNFFNNVPIVPTQQQINNATRNLLYSNILNPNNTTCPISLDIFNDTDNVTIIRHCRHIFKTPSIMNWFNTSCLCPICRYDIRTYNTSEYNETSSNQQNLNQSSETNSTNNNEAINNEAINNEAINNEATNNEATNNEATNNEATNNNEPTNTSETNLNNIRNNLLRLTESNNPDNYSYFLFTYH